MRLEDTKFIVTGGASGLGRHYALRLAEAGGQVVAGDVNEEALASLANEAKDCPGKLHVRRLDVGNEADVGSFVEFAHGAMGGLNGLINNAGILRDGLLVKKDRTTGAITKLGAAQWQAVIDVNLRAVFHCPQAVADTMVAQGAGVILNASSVVGLYGNFGQTNYAAAKFGVIGFTKTWSRELGPKGVRVNAVAPGFIETPILATIPDKVMDQMRAEVPLRRLGRPEEIANVYAFLASDEASYVNGAVLEVAGGLTV